MVSGSDSQRYPGADLLMSSVPHVAVVSELLREKHHNGTIWDEEFLQSPKLDSCLLEQLALGVDDEDIKSTLELNSMMSTDSTHVLLDRMPQQDVVWDVELLQGIGCQDGLLQQLVHGVDDHMQCKTVHPMLSKSDAGLEFDELPHKDVIWDEDMPSDLDTYEELLQQLALDSDYLIKENTKPIVVWEVDEMLELKVIGGDKSNVNFAAGIA